MENKMKLNNKKGFLLLEKNVISLVLTIIGLLLILVFIVYLFNIISTNQVKRNAQTALDKLEVSANSLENGKSVIVQLPGLNKESFKGSFWFLTSWSPEDSAKSLIPAERYLTTNIICVCYGEPYNEKTRADACRNIDSCREIKGISRIDMEIGKYNPPGAQGPTSSKPIEYPAIHFTSNLLQVTISKSNGVIAFRGS